MWILKATRDEEAYNAFMRAYENMMGGYGGLFDSAPTQQGERGDYGQTGDFIWLEDQGIFYNPDTGEAYKQTYDEEYDEYDEERIDIPTPVGAGLEGKVFRIPNTDYVVKIPMNTRHSRVRNMAEGGVDRMIRSPLEAYWSQVLSQLYPVAPYSVFASRHPMGKNNPTLNLVQERVDEYHPRYNDGSVMNAIHEKLFGLKDVYPQWEDMMYNEMGDDFNEYRLTPEETQRIKEIAGQYELYGDPDMKSNMYGNIALDYISDYPFREDRYGGLLEQEEIDRLLEAAIFERDRLPKRYQQLEPGINRRIERIIDALVRSKEEGRLVDPKVWFSDSRMELGAENFGRGWGPNARLWDKDDSPY